MMNPHFVKDATNCQSNYRNNQVLHKREGFMKTDNDRENYSVILNNNANTAQNEQYDSVASNQVFNGLIHIVKTIFYFRNLVLYLFPCISELYIL